MVSSTPLYTYVDVSSGGNLEIFMLFPSDQPENAAEYPEEQLGECFFQHYISGISKKNVLGELLQFYYFINQITH